MRYSKQGSLYKRRMQEAFQVEEDLGGFRIEKPYQMSWTSKGLSSEAIAWAKAIYLWWQAEAPLSQMPREPQDLSRKARGNAWRGQIKAWAEEGKHKKAKETL